MTASTPASGAFGASAIRTTKLLEARPRAKASMARPYGDSSSASASGQRSSGAVGGVSQSVKRPSAANCSARLAVRAGSAAMHMLRWKVMAGGRSSRPVEVFAIGGQRALTARRRGASMDRRVDRARDAGLRLLRVARRVGGRPHEGRLIAGIARVALRAGPQRRDARQARRRRRDAGGSMAFAVFLFAPRRIPALALAAHAARRHLVRRCAVLPLQQAAAGALAPQP